MYAAVTDGGEFASIKETETVLKCKIDGRRCLCHLLNNVIKRLLNDYFEETILGQIRKFISQVNYSDPFKKSWDEACTLKFHKTVCLCLIII